MHQFYCLSVSGTQTDPELSSRAALILGDMEVLHTEGHPGNSRLTLLSPIIVDTACQPFILLLAFCSALVTR